MNNQTVPAHVPEELVRPFDATTDPDLAVEPFKTFARLQADQDIFYNPLAFQGAGGWVVTRARLLKEILQDPELFSSRRNTGFGVLLGDDSFDLIPLEIDPPDHMKYRINFNRPLSPQAIGKMEPLIREKAISLTEEVRDKGECNFNDAFATPLPVDIFMLLMGVQAQDRDKVLGYGYRLLHHTNSVEIRAQAARDIYDYLVDLHEHKKRNPADDLATMMANMEVDGRPATDKEVMGMYYLLLIGGLDTVASSLGFAFRYLAKHPEVRERLRDNKAMIPMAVEEFLRMHSIVEVRRSVTRDTEFHGVQLKKGDFMNCISAMGSLDPEEFEKPFEPNFERQPNRHFAFILGPHRCMGSNLARMELRVAIEEWLDRIPDFSIKEGEEETIRVHQGAVLSLSHLPLVW